MSQPRYLVMGLLFAVALGVGPESRAVDPGLGVSSELDLTATTTPDEKLQYASEGLTEMEEAVRSISKLLETAKRENDTEAVQCLTVKITGVRALMAVAVPARDTMSAAIAANDMTAADHEFRKISVARTKTQSLMTEAQGCSRLGEQESGQTSIDLVVNEGDDFTPDDNDFGDLDAVVDFENPGDTITG